MNQSLVDKSHVVACILHLREASRCIEGEHENISLAILKLAESIASLHSVEDDNIQAMEKMVDEVREA